MDAGLGVAASINSPPAASWLMFLHALRYRFEMAAAA
jgi:hypothetical protein